MVLYKGLLKKTDRDLFEYEPASEEELQRETDHGIN